MSWQCTSWALREAECPTATARLVLIALADRCQPDGRSAWPTVQTLMAEAHASEASVRRALRDLEALGTIRRGNQDLASRDEHGRFLPEQYRPVVWECCMGAPLEHVAQKPGKQARAERARRSVEHGVGDDDFGGIKMTPLDVQTCQIDTSRPVTGDTPIYVTNIKTNINPNNPLAAARTSPQGQELDENANAGIDDAARRVIDRLFELRVRAGLSVGSSRRDEAAVAALVAQHGLDRVLDMLEWVYTKQSSRWWVKRTRTAAAFARVFDELADARLLDEQLADGSGKDVSVVAKRLALADMQRQQRLQGLLERPDVPAHLRDLAAPLLQELLDSGADNDEEALRSALEQAQVLFDHAQQQRREALLDGLYEQAGLQFVRIVHPEASIRELAGSGVLQGYIHDFEVAMDRDTWGLWLPCYLEYNTLDELEELQHNHARLREIVQHVVDHERNEGVIKRQVLAEMSANPPWQADEAPTA